MTPPVAPRGPRLVALLLVLVATGACTQNDRTDMERGSMQPDEPSEASRGDGGTRPACDVGTYDIPSPGMAELICRPGPTCTICEQVQDGAGVPTLWAVFEEGCECAGPALRARGEVSSASEPDAGVDYESIAPAPSPADGIQGLCFVARAYASGSAGLFRVERLRGMGTFTHVHLSLVEGWRAAEDTVARIVGPEPSGHSYGWEISLRVGETVGLLLNAPSEENEGYPGIEYGAVFNEVAEGRYSRGFWDPTEYDAAELRMAIEDCLPAEADAD